jgi:uncharacterized protein YjbI with pentapeptide repeats
MIPNDRKTKNLSQGFQTRFSPLLQQGGIVLGSFGGMLLFTGGTPSRSVVGLTAILSGAVALWLRQNQSRNNRLKTSCDLAQAFLKLPEPSEADIQNWLQQTVSKDLSANKRAVLHQKLRQLALDTKEIEKVQPLVLAIKKSGGSFFQLVSIAELNLLEDFSKADLSGTDLRTDPSEPELHGANLSETNFHNANLSGVNFHEVNLQGANLSDANLSWAYLFGADLQEANLSNATLYGANFSKANLRDANLTGANLSESNLRGADLRGANLSEAQKIQGAQLGDVLGICPDLKRHFQSRGAIFDDTPGDREVSLFPR